MDTAPFDLSRCFAADAPAASPAFAGFPKFNFIGGHNDPVEIPRDKLAEAAASVIKREGHHLAMYNLGLGPQGYPPLRDFVADKLSKYRGITATRDDVLITSGSGQGIDLVAKLMLTPGDTVLIEEFTYGGALSKFRKMGMNVLGCALDEGGIRIDALEAQLAGLAAKGITPKFIYTIPTIQNPTGSVMPLDRRLALIEVAKRFGVAIFEDECYADLTWATDAPPALYALDPSCVIHIGSFSKSLAPALRVGYAVAGWPVMSRLITGKTDGGTGALDQMVIAEYFATHWDSHMAHLNTILAGKLDAMQQAVAAEFGTAAEPWTPKGGIFLWFKLPDEVDVRKLIAPAAAAGISFNPGPEWAVDGDAAKSYLRLCFALPDIATIKAGVAEFARICHEQTGIPVRSGNVQRGS